MLNQEPSKYQQNHPYFFIVDFKFLKTLKTNALTIVENTNMSMGDFFGKFKNLASTILMIPWLE